MVGSLPWSFVNGGIKNPLTTDGRNGLPTDVPGMANGGQNIGVGSR